MSSSFPEKCKYISQPQTAFLDQHCLWPMSFHLGSFTRSICAEQTVCIRYYCILDLVRQTEPIGQLEIGQSILCHSAWSWAGIWKPDFSSEFVFAQGRAERQGHQKCFLWKVHLFLALPSLPRLVHCCSRRGSSPQKILPGTVSRWESLFPVSSNSGERHPKCSLFIFHHSLVPFRCLLLKEGPSCVRALFFPLKRRDILWIFHSLLGLWLPFFKTKGQYFLWCVKVNCYFPMRIAMGVLFASLTFYCSHL